MRANKKRNTRPELIVRRLLFSLGYRYRIYSSDLPGRPDLVFRKRRKLIFVNGCFWHQHSDERCHLRSHPKTNLSYWRPKLQRNVMRDQLHASQLTELGWKTLVIWECELKDGRRVAAKVCKFLGSPRQGS
jgi:DNA mismatch endonuclease, patch repair protein